MFDRILARISLAAWAAALALSSLSAKAAAELEGRWASAFTDVGVHAVRMEHEFRDDVATFRLWIQTTLPYQTRGMMTERRGRYRIVGPSSAVEGGLDVDVVVERVTLTFLDADSIQLVNERQDGLACGMRDWRLGEAKEVTGLTCEDQGFAAAGMVERLTVKVDGTRLLWGSYWGTDAIVPRSAADANGRATRLDESQPLLRQ